MTEPMTIEAQYTSRGRAWLNELKRSGNGSVAPLIECLNEMTHEAQIDFAVRCIALSLENEFAEFMEWKYSRRNDQDTVWNIATAPYSGAHFATFPPALVEPCIKAGTSERGVCPECGAGWVRVVDRIATGETQKMADGWDTGEGGHKSIHRNGRESGEAGVPVMRSCTTGWAPSCDCCQVCDHFNRLHSDGCEPYDPIPATVLDIFCGSGTTGLVARKLGRSFVGLDLSMKYLTENARERLSLTALDEWESGIQDDSDLSGLPMFSEETR